MQQDFLNEELVKDYITIEPGAPYLNEDLLRFQQGLTASGYTSSVKIEPNFEEAVDEHVPLDVSLVPAKRHRIVLGAGYADRGPRISGRWTNRRVNRYGHLLDRLHLQKIQVNLPTMRVKVDDFVLDWNPSELLQRKFHLALLKIDAVTIDTVSLAEQTPETEQEKPIYPIDLPELAFPLTVIIDSVRIDGIEIVNAPNTDPLRIETVALKALWNDRGLEVQQLGFLMPGMEFRADGRLTPVGDYLMEIHTLLRLAQESLPEGRLQGTIEGDKNRLDITQRFEGDAQIDLAAALSQPLENLGWDGTLTLKEIPGRLINPQFPAQLEGQIRTRGDLKTAQLDGHLLAASQSDPTIDMRSEFALTADLEQSSIFPMCSLWTIRY
jgi:autotransporter translocation and assembly factor TamB